MAEGHARRNMEEEIEADMAERGSVFSDLTTIDIPSEGCEMELTLIGTDEFHLKDGSIMIRTLQLNRVLTLEMLEQKMQGWPSSKHSGFYTTRCGDVCYAINDGNRSKAIRTVFYPYCREPTIQRIENGFYKTTEALGKFRWNLKLNELTETPGCICGVKHTTCRQGICSRTWGTELIHVACWSTLRAYHLIEGCAKNVNARIRLARVKWTEVSGIISHEINGVLLERKLFRELKEDLNWNLLAEEEGEEEED